MTPYMLAAAAGEAAEAAHSGPNALLIGGGTFLALVALLWLTLQFDRHR